MKSKRNTLGLIGLVIGITALGAALFHFWAGPINESPPLEEVVADKAVKIRDSVVARLKGEEPATTTKSRVWDADRIVDISTVAGGFLAIVLGAVAFIRREDLRISGSAVAFGGGAIAFQFAAIAVGAIVFAILIAAVLSKLDFGIG